MYEALHLDIDYPDYDGNPMSDNTLQFEWIVKLKENLEILFAAVLDVFVAGDLLWYPVEGDNKICQAPDVMVAIGRPKGYRGSYKQWDEGNIAPQVAVEILSPGNRAGEMAAKLSFYERYGVEEYYLYDPYKNRLSAWARQGEKLAPIANPTAFVSPRLGIRFALTGQSLVVYRPDGQPFLSSVELAAQGEQERARADQAQLRANQAEAQLQQVVINLTQAGFSPDQIAAAAGLSLAQVAQLQST
jgi:Uma2 family endonuclease